MAEGQKRSDVSARLGPFLRPDNLKFRALVAEQAQASGMPPAVISQLPLGTDLVLIDPPSLESASGDALSTSAVAAVVVTVLLAVLVCVAAVLAIYRRRRLEAKKEAARAVRIRRYPHR